jgi:hypothetical protein
MPRALFDSDNPAGGAFGSTTTGAAISTRFVFHFEISFAICREGKVSVVRHDGKAESVEIDGLPSDCWLGG